MLHAPKGLGVPAPAWPGPAAQGVPRPDPLEAWQIGGRVYENRGPLKMPLISQTPKGKGPDLSLGHQRSEPLVEALPVLGMSLQKGHCVPTAGRSGPVRYRVFLVPGKTSGGPQKAVLVVLSPKFCQPQQASIRTMSNESRAISREP